MLNLKELRQDIHRMTRRQELYRVLKEELTRLGYWRNLKRGKPMVENLRGKDKVYNEHTT